jgi:NAD(P)-dependent dehydrogenase (short-subunit alcohol dehydrogenase family)
MTGRLDGKVAIVTGAASWGFGRTTAVLFAREGAGVVIGDLDERGSQETLDQIKENGGRAECVIGDVSIRETATALVERALSSFGRLDVLVNNAGIAQPSQLDTWSVDDDEWDRVIATNLRSVFVCSRAAIPTMLAAGHGSIVNLASISVHVSVGGSAYCATKGGILSYTRATAAELAPGNVRINCVSPGIHRTPMSTGERMGLSSAEQEERIAAMGQIVPMGHTGDVDDIANAVLFLASDEAKYITGQEIVVDGGYVVRTMMMVPPGGFGGA